MVFWVVFVGAVDILNELIAALMFNGSVAFGYDGDIHVGVDTCCYSNNNKKKMTKSLVEYKILSAN